MMVRARFVGPDGLSFFDEIDYSPRQHGVYLRYTALELPLELGALTPGDMDALRVELQVYEREVWHIPIGPIACPLPAHEQFHPDGRYDVVYRYKKPAL